MPEISWNETKRIVYERAGGCCEYCQTCDYNTGQTMHIDHIFPQNGNELDNLCLACAACNMSKSDATSAVDPETQEIVSLFNPRNQIWHDHFLWNDGGIRVQGKTAIGRATVDRLKMNQERIIRVRRNWIVSGTHPPK